tara:strand:- start:330 stop:434 length:105 start_codon:yes stop_codon:yes gene_type:complete
MSKTSKTKTQDKTKNISDKTTKNKSDKTKSAEKN